MDRAEKRRQLKSDSKAIAHGLDVALRDGAQVAALMRVLHDHVRQAQAEKSIDAMMEFFYEKMERSARRLSNIEVACRKGCSHCCHARVVASVPEVLFVGKAGRYAQQRAQEEIFDYRAGTPCPMLKENLCGVYANRPIVCRTAASADARICERAFLHLSGETIPTPTLNGVMKTGYCVALSGALRQAGLVHFAYEFRDAMKMIFDNPGAEQEWLEGRDIFAGLAADPGGDLFRAEWNESLYRAAFG